MLCVLRAGAFIQTFMPINWFADKAWLKIEFLEIISIISITTRNATRCNNRDHLLHLSFILEISMFSETYI